MKISKKHIGYILAMGQVSLWLLIIYETSHMTSIKEGPEIGLATSVFLCLPFILIINVNWYFLAPRFLKRRKYKQYFFYLAICILFCSLLLSFNNFINGQDDLWLISGDGEAKWLIPSFLTLIYAIFMTYLLSLPFYLSLNWFDQQTEIGQLENEQLKTEVSSLRNQLNPHFFFNTLNNLYALSINRSEQAPEVILKLSELMRYVTYEAKNEQVSIDQEMEYLQSYFEIQSIRYPSSAKLNFFKDVDERTTKIAPLLFINLFENAFKHQDEQNVKLVEINATLSLKNRNVIFRIKNSKTKVADFTEGLGISNLRRRLSLYYPDRYNLDFHSTPKTFEATLSIEQIDEISNSR